MRVENTPTMTWAEAPDTIDPEDLSKILGIGIESARRIFDKKDFPKVSKEDIGNQGKADKVAARMYLQGIKIKEHPKDALLFMIYQELVKINQSKELKVDEDIVISSLST